MSYPTCTSKSEKIIHLNFFCIKNKTSPECVELEVIPNDEESQTVSIKEGA